MKNWTLILAVLAFLLWFFVYKIWDGTNKSTPFPKESDSFIFPTPKINTTEFESSSSPTLTNQINTLDSSSSSGIIKY